MNVYLLNQSFDLKKRNTPLEKTEGKKSCPLSCSEKTIIPLLVKGCICKILQHKNSTQNEKLRKQHLYLYFTS